MKLLYDNIAVAPIKEEETSASGIILVHAPDDNITVKGVVTHIGTGIPNSEGGIDPHHINIGETVIYHKNSGTPIKYHGDTYIILKPNQIYAVL